MLVQSSTLLHPLFTDLPVLLFYNDPREVHFLPESGPHFRLISAAQVDISEKRRG